MERKGPKDRLVYTGKQQSGLVKLTHSVLNLNLRFDMCVVFITNYFFSGRRRPDRQQDALSDQLCESQN
jgi:hypothetical protein